MRPAWFACAAWLAACGPGCGENAPPEGLWDVGPRSLSGAYPNSHAVACLGGYCTSPAPTDPSGRASWSESFPVSGGELERGITLSVTGPHPDPICQPRRVSFSASDLRAGSVAVSCGAATLTVAIARHSF